MSGDAAEVQLVPGESTERRRARRFLWGLCVGWLGVGLTLLAVVGVLPSCLLWFGVIPICTGLGWGLATRARRSRDSWALGVTRNLRRIARTARMPDLGTTVMVYACTIAGLTSIIVALIVH
jgi:hypothetical protein